MFIIEREKIDNFRFELELEDPKVKFFKSSNSNVDYHGPQTMLGLTSFINENMGRGPTQKKVVINYFETSQETI